MKFLFVILLTSIFVSCSSDKKDQEANVIPDTARNIKDNPTGSADGPKGDALAAHFYCPKNCAGGFGPEQGPCPVCGTAMAHNAAFHQKPGEPSVSINSEGSEVPYHEHDQNETGQFHFICPGTCGTGGGEAGNCPKCGKAMVHNAGYHSAGKDPAGGGQHLH